MATAERVPAVALGPARLRGLYADFLDRYGPVLEACQAQRGGGRAGRGRRVRRLPGRAHRLAAAAVRRAGPAADWVRPTRSLQGPHDLPGPGAPRFAASALAGPPAAASATATPSTASTRDPAPPATSTGDERPRICGRGQRPARRRQQWRARTSSADPAPSPRPACPRCPTRVQTPSSWLSTTRLTSLARAQLAVPGSGLFVQLVLLRRFGLFQLRGALFDSAF